MSLDALRPTDALRKAMQTGIEARQGVLGIAKSKKGNKDGEDQAKELLEASSERLLGMLEILEVTAGKYHSRRGRKLD